MSIKESGKRLEKKVVGSSRTVSRDVKREMGRAGRGLAKGARTVGRDVESGGKKVGKATRDGMTKVGDRLRPSRRRKSRKP